MMGTLEPRDGFETQSKRQHEITIEGASEAHNRSASSVVKSPKPSGNKSNLVVRKSNFLEKGKTNELKVPRTTIGPSKRRVNLSPKQFQNYTIGTAFAQ